MDKRREDLVQHRVLFLLNEPVAHDAFVPDVTHDA